MLNPIAGSGRVLVAGEGGHSLPWLPGSWILRFFLTIPSVPQAAAGTMGHGCWQQLLEVRSPSTLTDNDHPDSQGADSHHTAPLPRLSW